MRRTKPTTKWNLDKLKNPQNRYEYQNKLNKQLKDKNIRDMDEMSVRNKGKACGEDSVPIELLQCMEEEGIETVTRRIDQVWDTLKECIEEIAEEICGKEQHKNKQNWMTAEILHNMEERRRYKNVHTVEGDKKYKEIKHSIPYKNLP